MFVGKHSQMEFDQFPRGPAASWQHRVKRADYAACSCALTSGNAAIERSFWMEQVRQQLVHQLLSLRLKNSENRHATIHHRTANNSFIRRVRACVIIWLRFRRKLHTQNNRNTAWGSFCSLTKLCCLPATASAHVVGSSTRTRLANTPRGSPSLLLLNRSGCKPELSNSYRAQNTGFQSAAPGQTCACGFLTARTRGRPALVFMGGCSPPL